MPPLPAWVIRHASSGRTRRSPLPRHWLWSLAVLGCWLGTVPMGPLIVAPRSRRDHRNEPGVERSDTPGHPHPNDAGTPEGCVTASRSNTARSAVSRSGEPCPPFQRGLSDTRPAGGHEGPHSRGAGCGPSRSWVVGWVPFRWVRSLRLPDPGGITEISRGSSKATPPVTRTQTMPAPRRGA